MLSWVAVPQVENEDNLRKVKGKSCMFEVMYLITCVYLSIFVMYCTITTEAGIEKNKICLEAQNKPVFVRCWLISLLWQHST